ncbi:MAG: right-handed parallel beta-helix repeat-containing protein [Phycisphaerales bacterium]|nr:right-handed parallel beta-helix repeat-containing protein [Phycisphaerales bacterium]
MGFGVLIAGHAAIGQPVRYVDKDAEGANNGSNWANAYTNLQSALTPAVVTTHVWVADGTYRPGLAVPRTVTFQLQNNLEVYGGFDGTETMLSERSPETNVTILSGDLNSNDSYVGRCTADSPDCDSFGKLCDEGFCIIASNNAENVYHVVTGSGTNATAVLDGFTITSGNANVCCDPSTTSGAGMVNDAGSPTVINCTFAGNSASFGAGMFNDTGSNPVVKGCRFRGNSATSGGGMLNETTSSPKVSNCYFIANHAIIGGGMKNTANSDPTVTNCQFLGNKTGITGGGGGMDNDLSSPTVTNCGFSGNSALNGGGMGNYNFSNPLVTNCTFSGNSAGIAGGGMNNTFSSNPTVTNSILWGNSDGGGMDESAQIHTDSGTPVVNYSTVQGGWTGAGGTGNGSADPGFFDADGLDNVAGTTDDDLRLQPGSQAIDASNNAAVPADDADLDNDLNTNEPVPYDLRNNARFRDAWNVPNSGSGSIPIVDMGAYESVGTVVLVDATPTGWAGSTALTTDLQSALTFAQSYFDEITEIWVAAGTYTPGADRSDTFQLLNGVGIYGGFAGNETSLFQRDVDENVTILSGDLTDDDTPVACTANSPDCDSFGGLCLNGHCIIADNNDENSYHVVTGSGTNATGILDGFTITAGNANGGPFVDWGGGGVSIVGGSPTVTNCTIVGNSAIARGGAMHNHINSSPSVTNCTFVGNSSSNFAGGIFNNSNSSPTVVNCIFAGNSAGLDGGGMLNNFSSNAVLTNCVFSGNICNRFGAALNNSNSSDPIVVNCVFSRNTSMQNGGGMYNFASPMVSNCILWGNVDSGGTDESAQIDTQVGTPTVNYSIVQGGWTGAGGTGNSAADPLFFDADGVDGIVGTADDDLRPIGGSPAIDAGDNFAVPADFADLNDDFDFAERTPIDLAGKLRFVDDLGTSDTGVDDPPNYPYVVDMGAYEYFPDCNHNGVADDIDIMLATSLDVNGDDIPDECAQWNPPLVNDGLWGTAGNWAPPVVPDNVMDDVFDVTISGSVEVVTLNINADVNSLKLLDDATLNVTLGDLNVLTAAGIIVDGTLNVTGTHTLDSAGPVVVDDSPDVFALGGCVPPPTVSLRGSGSHTMTSLTVQECAQVLAGDSVTTLVSGPVLIGPGGFYGPDPDRLDPSAAELTCNGLGITGNEFAAGVFELDDTMMLTVNGDVNLIAGGPFPSSPSARLLGGCVPPPTLRARGFATLIIAGSLNVSECAEVSFGPNVTFGLLSPGDPAAPETAALPTAGPEPLPSVALRGNMVNAQTEPSRFNWRFGELVLSAGPSHQIEAAGEDRGAAPDGFTNNYAIGRMELAATSATTVVDQNLNGSASADALYVGELVLQSGSTLTLLAKLYAGRVINNGGMILTPGLLDTVDCVTDAQCDDGIVCTTDDCSGGGCAYAFALFGDVNADGGVDIFDILCVLDGFAGVFTTCSQPSVDLAPCPAGDEMIDIFDILAVLDAFAGSNGCCSP